MTEKRFELKVNQHNRCDIVDWVESEEKNAICIYNDLGDYYFSSAKALCELLNELNDENNILKQQLKTKYIVNKQYEELQKVKEENHRLKNDCGILVQANQEYRKVNEQLKQFKEQVFNIINKKLQDNERLDGVDTAMYYANRQTLNELKKELEE